MSTQDLIKQISIHALREESDTSFAIDIMRSFISIHALREESDKSEYFLLLYRQISIHALREESDRLYTLFVSCNGDFYPRSP